MRALAGAGAFGLVPHPSTAALDAYGNGDYSMGLTRTELELKRPDHPRDAAERMVTQEELARIFRELGEIVFEGAKGSR